MLRGGGGGGGGGERDWGEGRRKFRSMEIGIILYNQTILGGMRGWWAWCLDSLCVCVGGGGGVPFLFPLCRDHSGGNEGLVGLVSGLTVCGG